MLFFPFRYSSSIEGNLTATCNMDCNCEDAYDPVCGSDDILYYSSCHAGCAMELDPTDNGNKVCQFFYVDINNIWDVSLNF